MACKKNKDGLTIRKLKVKDASSYAKISYGEDVCYYLRHFWCRDVATAEKIISANTKYGREMYGLFKRKTLVSVFYVSPNYMDGAEIHYFTGEQYSSNNYATTGIEMLSSLLADRFDYFCFSIRKTNIPSLKVQEKLGSSELPSRNENYRDFCFSFN